MSVQSITVYGAHFQSLVDLEPTQFLTSYLCLYPESKLLQIFSTPRILVDTPLVFLPAHNIIVPNTLQFPCDW